MIAGDLVFCHSSGMIGRLIRLGQRIRRNPNWELNHVATLDVYDEAKGDWKVIQAVGAGVTNTAYLADITPGGYYKVVALPAQADRDKYLEFERAQVGAKYGYLTDACIALNILTPRWVAFDIRRDGTWICSAVAAAGLEFAGWKSTLHISDIYQVTPAELDDLVAAASTPRKGK